MRATSLHWGVGWYGQAQVLLEQLLHLFDWEERDCSLVKGLDLLHEKGSGNCWKTYILGFLNRKGNSLNFDWLIIDMLSIEKATYLV